MVYAIDVNNDGMISESELLDMMEQFGIQDGMTTNEIQVLFDELGEVVQAQRNNDETIAKQIPTHTVEELILSHIR